MKTHWKKAFNKEYLGSHDLEGDLVATIDHVEVRKIKGGDGSEESRNVAIFKGNVKPMILNVTSCKQIATFANSKFIEDWNNLPITIYVATVQAFGEQVEALRIKGKQPNLNKPKLTPTSPQWVLAVAYLQKDGTTIDGIRKHYDITEEDLVKLQEEAI